MKVFFAIAYIQYTIGLQLYLLIRYIGKVIESGIKVASSHQSGIKPSKFLVMLKNE